MSNEKTVKREPVDFDFTALNWDFLKQLAQIPPYAAEKYGSWEQYRDARLRGEKSPLNHIFEHARKYMAGEPYEKFDAHLGRHLVAIAYNAMMEWYYLHRWGHEPHPLNIAPTSFSATSPGEGPLPPTATVEKVTLPTETNGETHTCDYPVEAKWTYRGVPQTSVDRCSAAASCLVDDQWYCEEHTEATIEDASRRSAVCGFILDMNPTKTCGKPSPRWITIYGKPLCDEHAAVFRENGTRLFDRDKGEHPMPQRTAVDGSTTAYRRAAEEGENNA